MLGNLHLEELSGNSLAEVFRNLLARLPGWKNILPFLERYSDGLLIFGIVLALLQCLCGYRLRKYWTGFECLAVFSAAGAMIAYEKSLGLGAVIAISTGAGLLGCLFGYFLWLIGCMFRSSLFISILVFAVCSACDLTVLGIIIGLASGMIAAILTIAFSKPFLIFYTSFTGAFVIAAFFTELVPAVKEIKFVPIIIGAFFVVLGLFIQIITNRPKSRKADISMGNTGGMLNKTEISGMADLKGTESNSIADIESTESSGIADLKSTESNSIADIGSTESGSMPDLKSTESNSIADIGSTESGSMAALKGKEFCPSCGAEYKEGAKFCIKCGQKRLIDDENQAILTERNG